VGPPIYGSDPAGIGLGPIDCAREVVLKFAPDGVPLWNQCVAADNIAVLPDGGFITTVVVAVPAVVGGQSYTAVGDYDALLASYDASGAWSKTYCTSEPGSQIFGNAIRDSTRALIVPGAFDTQLTLPGGMTLASVDPNIWTAFVASIAP
jgi:hypothetical protein